MHKVLSIKGSTGNDYLVVFSDKSGKIWPIFFEIESCNCWNDVHVLRCYDGKV